MPETNTTQQLMSPGEEALKERRTKEIKDLVFKFRAFRWILFTVFGFALVAAFDIVPWITRGSHRLAIPAGVIWVIFIFSPIAWYVSHCLKFTRAWENTAVFRLGASHPTNPVRKPGLTWTWYFLDKPVFVRSDQQQIPLPKLSILSGDNIELTIPAFFICKITEPMDFLVKVSNGIKALTDMVESAIRSEVGVRKFEKVREDRDEIAKKIIGDLAEQTEQWGLKLLQIRLLDVDVPDDVVEKIKNVLKAEKDKEVVIINADAKKAETERLADAELIKVKKAAEGAQYKMEKEGEGMKSQIKAKIEALGPDGAKIMGAVMMIEQAQIQEGDKLIIGSDITGIPAAAAIIKQAIDLVK